MCSSDLKNSDFVRIASASGICHDYIYTYINYILLFFHTIHVPLRLPLLALALALGMEIVNIIQTPRAKKYVRLVALLTLHVK